MRAALLGLDVGTSACKTTLFDEEGAVLHTASFGYPLETPQPGWAQQHPDDWYAAACRGIRAVLAGSGIAPGAVAAVAVDGQSWAAVAVDGAGDVLCPTPIWMDTRAREQCDRMAALCGEQALFDLCGNRLSPTYTLPKILWYRDHAPEVFRHARSILQSNSYIVFRLTGEPTAEASQGFGLHCFDMRRDRYDDSVCRVLGIPEGLLPPISPSHAVVGRVTAQAAAQCGLLEGTPVVAGGMDTCCGALGAGILRAGQTQEQGGSSGGMNVCLETYAADRALILARHVIPGQWLIMGGTVGGGGSLKWFAEQFGAAEREEATRRGCSAYDVLCEEAAAVPAGSGGVTFLPYLNGERTPIWDVNAKGVFYGLDYGKTRAHAARAVLEGVAFSLLHNIDVAQEAGVSVGGMVSIGGGAQSPFWTQMKSDVTGRPIAVPGTDTAAGLGAAMLAGLGVGVYRDFAHAVGSTVRIVRRHAPDPAAFEAYRLPYRRYRELYGALKDFMARY